MMIPSKHDEVKENFSVPGVVLGTYNSLPEPMKRISKEEFFERLVFSVITATELRHPRDFHFTSLRVFWMRDHGMGISTAGAENIHYWFIGHNRKLNRRCILKDGRMTLYDGWSLERGAYSAAHYKYLGKGTIADTTIYDTRSHETYHFWRKRR